MNLSERSKLSLCQFLIKIFNRDNLVLLLQKHQIPTDELEFSNHESQLLRLTKEALQAASPNILGEILQELARTSSAIRTDVSPRHKFDGRWDDLCRCLELDGYLLSSQEPGIDLSCFYPIGPRLPGTTNPEDDLIRELKKSVLIGADEIISNLEKSSKTFLEDDFNGCLSNARVALQALATAIAKGDKKLPSSGYDDSKWGQVLDRLKSTGFITANQEKGLAGVFGFISDGAHKPLGFSENEFARLGRTLALSFCYFLVKTWNAKQNPDAH